MIKPGSFKTALVRSFYLSHRFWTIGPISYLRFYVFLQRSQWWTRRQLRQYQLAKLKELISYVYKNVPYYREMFKKLRITPEAINSFDDLRKLPILTRDMVIKNADKLISSRVDPKYLEKVQTSGSTGKPMQFFRDKRDEFIRIAFLKRFAETIGIGLNDKHVYLWSRPFIEKAIRKASLYEPQLRRLSLSSAPQAQALLSEHLESIRKFKPVFLQGNPSMLYQLACVAQEQPGPKVRFKCFINLFENIFSYQRALIEKQFDCKVYNLYLSEEQVVSAFECPKHEGLHIEMERGILEVLGEDGKALPARVSGRLVGTSLHNFTFPLIRYDTDDIGSLSEERCSCGRSSPLLKTVDGRSNEVIRYKDKLIYATTLSVILWKFNMIKECQFIQEQKDCLKVVIVRRSGYTDNDTRRFLEMLKTMIDKELDITIEFSEQIPRTKMGKFPLVVSKLNASARPPRPKLNAESYS